MPTDSGGLGMLTGNMLRAAADRELPMVGGHAARVALGYVVFGRVVSLESMGLPLPLTRR
jgi:hypothetical protein